MNIPLTEMIPGVRVVIPLPEGDWITPPGWERRGNTIRATWSPEHGTSVELTQPAPVMCGLCGLELLRTDDALSKRGHVPTTNEPDAHIMCYRKSVEEKVSAPGGPASPYAPPEPEVPEWVQPTGAHDAYPVGARVSYNGRIWENTHTAANAWAPGVAGWTEVV